MKGLFTEETSMCGWGQCPGEPEELGSEPPPAETRTGAAPVLGPGRAGAAARELGLPTRPRQLQPAAGLTAWLLEGSDTRNIPHCGEPASQAQSRTEEGREQRGPSTARGRAGFGEGPEAEPEAGIGVTGLDVILGGT